MKIGVIVPFWNSEKWLERCCKSLYNNKGDFEFIFVDDHSTDAGREIIYEYCDKDPRFMLTINQHMKGVSGARNTGLDYAVRSCDWITFLDADDTYLPDAYFHYCDAIFDNKEANTHQFNHVRYYAENGMTKVRYANAGGSYNFANMPQAYWAVWNKLYRTDFIENIRFKEGMQYGEDELFSLTCMCKDDHIHHADRKAMILQRRFDNKESLSHIKTAEAIRNSVRAFEDLLDEQKSPLARAAIATAIGDQWMYALTRLYKEGK